MATKTTTPAPAGTLRRRRTPPSEAERQRRRDATRQRLDDAARELLTSEGWTRWAQARAAFHLYSLNNTLLIAQQRPSATHVAGFRRWLELGRAVRKGEKAIRILGPIRRRVEDEDSGERVLRVVGYRDVSIFDVGQTDPVPGADPAPLTAPGSAPVSGDSHAHLLGRLERFAGQLGYELRYERLPGALGGYCDPERQVIVIDAAQAANGRVRTAIHELAHALGVGYDAFSREQAEVIVETVAYITAAGAGLDTGCESIAYVAGWGEDGALDQVQRAAELIDGLARRLEHALLDNADATPSDVAAAGA